MNLMEKPLATEDTEGTEKTKQADEFNCLHGNWRELRFLAHFSVLSVSSVADRFL
jgi:hypothetical protein